tara:strand:+ start:1001 stop:1183 length:183 start_codon:yes stop_codon:yes gene_type:complete
MEYNIMDKHNLILLCSGVIITVLGYNFGLVIRDIHSINQAQQIEEIQYKQIPVIPFTNLQ